MQDSANSKSSERVNMLFITNFGQKEPNINDLNFTLAGLSSDLSLMFDHKRAGPRTMDNSIFNLDLDFDLRIYQ